MGKKDIKIFDSIEKINLFLKTRTLKIIEHSIKKRDLCTIALSGGNTPISFYNELSKDKTINWDKVHFFIVDERFVPDGHKDHNFTNIKKIFFDNIKIPYSNLHPIDTGCFTAKDASGKYDLELRSFFNTIEYGNFPIFDLIFLGIGTDEHTASLFPGTEALNEKEKLVTFLKPVTAFYERITLTLPVLNNAGNIVFLVTGIEKKDILKKILIDKNDLPVTKINPLSGNLLFVLDKYSSKEIKSI